MNFAEVRIQNAKIYLLLLICLTVKLVVVEATENTTANIEEEETIAPRSGLVSDIVGGITKPLNVLLPPKAKEAIVSPVKDVADVLDAKLKAIYPGTQWCGDGNRARSAEDLGLFKLTDDCCREHDNCPDNINAGKSRHGLNNTGLFTRSNCDCDDKFYDCLKEANTLISKKIGVTYFNILRPKCFRKDYPVLGCEKHEG
ncbi:Phospholipase A2 [Cryptotermes secundus]|uniref:Phospholipase A2 n=1 Tax=Cryptotermes secundus TaxID=105785 RepID=A0A2J7Q6T9_9NEOP|nr:Phospholipase A2 [Cryptotermes secundus]